MERLSARCAPAPASGNTYANVTFYVRAMILLIVACERDAEMLWTIAVILLILWLLGFTLNVAGGLIHILLVIAVIVGLIQLFTGRRAL